MIGSGASPTSRNQRLVLPAAVARAGEVGAWVARGVCQHNCKSLDSGDFGPGIAGTPLSESIID